jgi:hypothetical protein
VRVGGCDGRFHVDEAEVGGLEDVCNVIKEGSPAGFAGAIRGCGGAYGLVGYDVSGNGEADLGELVRVRWRGDGGADGSEMGERENGQGQQRGCGGKAPVHGQGGSGLEPAARGERGPAADLSQSLRPLECLNQNGFRLLPADCGGRDQDTWSSAEEAAGSERVRNRTNLESNE